MLINGQKLQGKRKMDKKITRIITEKINPLLDEHGGAAELTKFEDGIAWIQMTGSCASCPSAQFTIDDVVKEILMEEVPEVKDVQLDSGIDDEMMDFIQKILNKEI